MHSVCFSAARRTRSSSESIIFRNFNDEEIPSAVGRSFGFWLIIPVGCLYFTNFVGPQIQESMGPC
ncbi:hypothetical protein K469DRAFT_394526 [Zopfia rhizophila CBS 207.26]|uniref:Uncharacterized protein n=1 Tax=Zopfia rhizophila CBS 207.26 TaxID=1314779 RepID=A0A6A6EHG1_9PEZI|nr:hypothetical protein K469DRAFT_394526 [Zopfia rhizophila CBS 207.26]